MEYQNENFNGSYDFRSRSYTGWRIEAHLHEYSELLYCKEGEGTATVNGRRIELLAGQLIWIPPNYIHRYDFFNAKVVCAMFSNDFVPLFFKKAEGRSLVVTAVDMEELGEIAQELHMLHRNKHLLIGGYLNLICSKVLERAIFEENGSRDNVLYQKVISYISENYTEDVKLETLAKRFGYNEKYLSHALHELTGIHFCKLLSHYRVEKARKLLIVEKNTSISEIALRCGFSSFNTFYRAFKDITGVTPLEYRKKGLLNRVVP